MKGNSAVGSHIAMVTSSFTSPPFVWGKASEKLHSRGPGTSRFQKSLASISRTPLPAFEHTSRPEKDALIGRQSQQRGEETPICHAKEFSATACGNTRLMWTYAKGKTKQVSGEDACVRNKCCKLSVILCFQIKIWNCRCQKLCVHLFSAAKLLLLIRLGLYNHG